MLSESQWHAVVSQVIEEVPAWGGFFSHGYASECGDGIRVEFKAGSFAGKQAMQSEDALAALQRAVESVFGAGTTCSVGRAEQPEGICLYALEQQAPLPEQIEARERYAKEARERDERRKLERWQKLYRECAPVAVAAAAWDKLDMEAPAVTAVHKWLGPNREPQKHLVLRGGIGTGKTTAACYAVRCLTENAHTPPVVWMRPRNLVSAVLHDYDEKAPKLRWFVVLDDLGSETGPDLCEALCELIDRGGHRLIITTNLTRQQMRERYDGRLLDRLNETAIGVDIQGQSRRPKGAF